ncbi:MAG: peptide ABC transporter substrate-binding protein [Clostridia bacterium]|nr:peptide ABC transporter substrate-binding protein [Clostridia bacterium]
MKRFLAIALALALCLALFAGCNNDTGSNNQSSNQSNSQNSNQNESSNNNQSSDTPAKPKMITYAVDYDITSMDPQISGDSAAATVILMTNEGLLREKGGEIVPGIAETWEVSEDGLTYTFHLRKSTWNDGTPLTAHDFVYSYRRMLDPAAPTNYIENGYVLKNGQEFSSGQCSAEELGVEAPDDYTLVLTLSKRDNTHLYNLSRTTCWLPINEAADKAAGGVGYYGSDKDKLLTNGPFNLTDWSREASVTMEKNPAYWNAGEIKLDICKGIVGASGAAGVDMMLAGELDFMTTNVRTESSQLRDAGFNVEAYTGAYRYLYFNGNPGEKTQAGFCMANSHFRRAINYVINRNALAQVVSLDCEPSYRVIMPSEPGVGGKTINEMYPREYWNLDGDIEKAKAELDIALQELGLSSPADVPPLYLLCYDSQDSTMVLQAYQDMLKTGLGIESTVNPQAIQQMRELWHTGYWDVFVMDWGFRAPNWGQRADNWYRSDGRSYNDNGYVNAAFDAKKDEFDNAVSEEEAIRLLVELEEIFCEDAASAIVAWTQYSVCHTDRIKGILLSTYADFTFADVVD